MKEIKDFKFFYNVNYLDTPKIIANKIEKELITRKINKKDYFIMMTDYGIEKLQKSIMRKLLIYGRDKKRIPKEIKNIITN